MKTVRDIQNESEKMFLESIGEEQSLKLVRFHTFLCPVVIAEVMVKEHLVEEYDSFELLILRLYEIGFREVEDFVHLSGMGEAIVKRALYNEVNVYHHIDEKGQITEMGYETLRASEGENAINHTMFETPRRIQIEATTGTVIPAYLESKVEYMKPILEEGADGITPKETVHYDTELKKEINSRLKEYKHMGILNEGDTIASITKIKPRLIYYRWSYLVMFEGMTYPMVVMRGKKTIDNVGAEAIKKGDYGKQVVVPLAISATDAKYLKQHGIVFKDVIVRDDKVFEYLKKKAESFRYEKLSDDITVEKVEVVYEDEKVLESVEDEEMLEEGNEQ